MSKNKTKQKQKTKNKNTTTKKRLKRVAEIMEHGNQYLCVMGVKGVQTVKRKNPLKCGTCNNDVPISSLLGWTRSSRTPRIKRTCRRNGKYSKNAFCNILFTPLQRAYTFHVEVSSWIIYLTGGNWQKWKRVFLTCPCHEISRDEAVGLKSCKYTWKITIFVKMWNLGQYRENLIFCE